MGKFYMLLAAAQNGGCSWLIIFAVLCAVVSAYYYFKIIQAMFFKESNADLDNSTLDVTPAFKILLVITAVLIIVLGLFPGLVVDWLYY